jgi:2-iminobutanoate/2-iminopropanoate deaminase
MKQVKSNKAQSAEGLLSQATVSGNLIFTAGFIHMDESGDMIKGSVKEMTERVIENVKQTLEAAGSSLDNVVKATIYVTDMDILPEFNEYYIEYFSEPLPAREAVCVKELPLGAKIEMSVVAELK